MNTTDNFPLLFTQMLQHLIVQLPLLLVNLVGVILILSRWKEGSSGSKWALLGVGLSLFLCFAVPVGQIVTQHLMVQNGVGAQNMGWAFTGLSIVWSAMRAVSYAFLLAAIYSGRPNPDAYTPPHLQKM